MIGHFTATVILTAAVSADASGCALQWRVQKDFTLS